LTALLHRREQLAARPLAAAAGFGADPAVLVVMGVPPALISAGTAGCGAGLDGRAYDAEIELRLARHHAAGGDAQIGAVKTQANAPDHVSDVLLGETRVGASSARGRAVDAIVNAAKERLAIDLGWVWMRRDDLSNTHVDPFLSSADLAANREANGDRPSPAKSSSGLEPLTPSFATRTVAAARRGKVSAFPPSDLEKRASWPY